MMQRHRGKWWVLEEEKEEKLKPLFFCRHAGITGPPSAVLPPEGAAVRSAQERTQKDSDQNSRR